MFQVSGMFGVANSTRSEFSWQMVMHFEDVSLTLAKIIEFDIVCIIID